MIYQGKGMVRCALWKGHCGVRMDETGVGGMLWVGIEAGKPKREVWK